jgi:hypothetical protein
MWSERHIVATGDVDVWLRGERYRRVAGVSAQSSTDRARPLGRTAKVSGHGVGTVGAGGWLRGRATPVRAIMRIVRDRSERIGKERRKKEGH